MRVMRVALISLLAAQTLGRSKDLKPAFHLSSWDKALVGPFTDLTSDANVLISSAKHLRVTALRRMRQLNDQYSKQLSAMVKENNNVSKVNSNLAKSLIKVRDGNINKTKRVEEIRKATNARTHDLSTLYHELVVAKDFIESSLKGVDVDAVGDDVSIDVAPTQWHEATPSKKYVPGEWKGVNASSGDVGVEANSSKKYMQEEWRAINSSSGDVGVEANSSKKYVQEKWKAINSSSSDVGVEEYSSKKYVHAERKADNASSGEVGVEATSSKKYLTGEWKAVNASSGDVGVEAQHARKSDSRYAELRKEEGDEVDESDEEAQRAGGKDSHYVDLPEEEDDELDQHEEEVTQVEQQQHQLGEIEAQTEANTTVGSKGFAKDGLTVGSLGDVLMRLGRDIKSIASREEESEAALTNSFQDLSDNFHKRHSTLLASNEEFHAKMAVQTQRSRSLDNDEADAKVAYHKAALRLTGLKIFLQNAIDKIPDA